MRVIGIVQARMGSTRLPGKVMKKVMGVPLIELLLDRLKGAKRVSQIVVTTANTSENNLLVRHLESLGWRVYRGDEEDVLARYYEAAVAEKAEAVVRVTGDCPLIDCEIVDSVVDRYLKSDAQYASNIIPPTFPDGLDVEVFSFSALQRAHLSAINTFDREHVTPFIRRDASQRCVNVEGPEDYSWLRWTVDESTDLVVVKKIFEQFYPKTDFSWREIIQLTQDKPELTKNNWHLKRNNVAKGQSGQKLWIRAKAVIPGGNMLLSKRPEMFLPGDWPAYFSKAKGCEVWDLDGNRFTDMSIMGVGTNVLGYGREEVDEAVRKVISSGNMSTLNCPEEVFLAEKLIELHPWAEMVRFARTGGEANSIAVRLARAASGKDKVAFCGYHGWHDWYLAANLSGETDNLSPHLLEGLAPKGVASGLAGSVHPFLYGDFEYLQALVDQQDIGTIKMEVARTKAPDIVFLKKVRNLCNKKGIVLVFDECTSGFRQSFGGLHMDYEIQPDVAVFGKALGNGYAVTAVVGREFIMREAQSTFISSTFWTERIGSVAALATIGVMKEEKSWEKVTSTGREITQGWQSLAEKYEIPISITGLKGLPAFSFNGSSNLAYKTLITQEMLAKGYLATNCVYVCTKHTSALVANYLEALDPIFGHIKECEDGREIGTLLKAPICHSGFERLN